MVTKPHLSFTQLSMLSRCGEQYRRRYIEKEIVPPGIALHIGSGVDGGANANFSQKIETHEDLPRSDIVDMSVAAYDDSLRAGIEVENGKSPSAVINEGRDLTAALADCFATEVAPEYQPTEVQKASVIQFPNATHNLLAYTDVRDDKHRVTDLKTASVVKSQAAALSLQLTVYDAAFRIDRGHPPSELRLEHLRKSKNPRGSRRADVQITHRDIDDLKVLANRVNNALHVIATGAFTPCNMDDWVCSPAYCGYARTCPFWGRRG